ncbi:substrate-binding domain-containing protein [Alkaliphilus crotonatoxidans]
MKDNTPLTPQEVAEALRITKNTVYELIKRGELAGYKVGKKIRVDYHAVEAYKNKTKVQPEELAPAATPAPRDIENNSLVICGQDLLLDILSRYLEQHPNGVRTLRSFVGSYNGLFNLYQGSVQATAAHLWDGDTDQYNTPYVRRLLPGIPALLIRLCSRIQGFYVPKGNPKGIKGWEDLKRRDLTMVNREKGSGTRILLDEHLRLLGLSPGEGYHREYLSHLAVASAVSRGEADWGLGNEKTASQIDDIEFIPLQLEHYDLVIKKECKEMAPYQAILEIVSSAHFKNELLGIGGYDLSETGKIVSET